MIDSIDILKEIAQHQLEGLMLHSDMMNCYDFLGLRAFKRIHEYHMFKEMMERDSICRYAINHLNKIIINDNHVDAKFYVPQSWASVDRLSVTNTNRQSYLKQFMETWHDWEKCTKKFYSKKYKELCDNEDPATAKKVMMLLSDADMELKSVERWVIKLNEIDYDMKVIVIFEDEIHDKYAEKTKKLGIDIN